MEVSFYRHYNTFEFLPSISLNVVESETLNRKAYALLCGFMEWTLDIQWETNIV